MPEPKIIHNIYDNSNGFSHSLSIDNEESKRVGYREIARMGDYAATTLYYQDYLPRIFLVSQTYTTITAERKTISNKKPKHPNIKKIHN